MGMVMGYDGVGATMTGTMRARDRDGAVRSGDETVMTGVWMVRCAGDDGQWLDRCDQDMRCS